jgi:hypothetical protein
MTHVSAAEETRLLTATILETMPAADHDDPHSGHPAKLVLVLADGGQALAKLVPPGAADLRQQARNEVAAWRLLCLLGWGDIGVATVLRHVAVPGQGRLPAAVQTMLTGEDLGLCPDPSRLHLADTRRAATFDVLITNTDREGNWFGQGSPQRLRLIDHGHSFGVHGTMVQSIFVSLHADEQLDPSHYAALRTLTEQGLAQLSPLLPRAALASLNARRHKLLNGASLTEASS